MTCAFTDPARSGREAPRAKRALWKIFGISMPCALDSFFVVVLLALAASRCHGAARFARKPTVTNRLSCAYRVSTSKSFLQVGLTPALTAYTTPRTHATTLLCG
jgi:hypothetical protein